MGNKFICPITGIDIQIDKIHTSFANDGLTMINSYPISVNNCDKYIVLCNRFYEDLFYNHNDIRKQIEEVRTFINYEFINDGLKSLGGNIIHWNCPESKNKPNHLQLSETIPKLLSSTKYPRSRKQKADNILRYVYQKQSQEGQIIILENNIGVWGNLFMKNYNELLFYIEELERKNLIKFNSSQRTTRLTFDGLDTIENILESSRNMDEEFFEPQYDIGLSFAGEERSYVQQVADELTKMGVKVFYDNYETFDLWGKDLYQHLNDVYRNKCRYCIVFISKHYENKLWTRHELKAAQAKAFTENEEYILPIRFDETELPGMNPQTGYISYKDFTAYQIAEMANKKLRK